MRPSRPETGCPYQRDVMKTTTLRVGVTWEVPPSDTDSPVTRKRAEQSLGKDHSYTPIRAVPAGRQVVGRP
jgi:hypothetical protein